MEMISAVKTRKLLEKVFRTKFYGQYAFELLVNISKDNLDAKNIFFEDKGDDNILLVIISS